MRPRGQLNASNVTKRYVTTGAASPFLPNKNTVVTQVRNTNMLPFRNNVVSIEGSQPQILIPGSMNKTQQ